jgi:hypothetical protein
MKVFTTYSEPHAKNLRLWMRSWQKFGYEPQLIATRELKGSTLRAVVRKRGRGLLVRPGAFNLGHRRGKPTVKHYGTRGWNAAKVVIFEPSTSEEFLSTLISNAS